MSYVITIKRDPPIERDEWRRFVEDDETFTLVRDEAAHFEVEWTDPSQRDALALIFTEGEIWATPRNDAGFNRMLQIARDLNARLIGEEGEDLTDADLASRKSGCGTTATVAAIALIGGLALAALIS